MGTKIFYFKFLIYFGLIFLFGFEGFCTATSPLGSCFRIRYRNTSGCDHILRRNITRERCCTGQPKHQYRRAWSPPTPSPSPTLSQGHGRTQGHSRGRPSRRSTAFDETKQTDVGIWINETCFPCVSTCKDVRCGEDKKCVMRNGLPKCVCSPMCFLQHKSPVCGTDGRTYSSECQLLKRSCRKKKQLYVKHSGSCQTCRGVKCRGKRTCILDELLKPRCLKCPNSCSSNPKKKIRLICGTDGITYDSKCQLKLASCQAGVTISRAYKGPCREAATCQTVKCWKGESCLRRRDTNTPQCLWCEDLNDCPVTTTHICASDRNTYHSWCALRYASCRAKIALIVVPHHYCSLKNTSTTSTDEDEECLPKIGSDKRIINKIYSQDEKEALKNQDISSYFQSLKLFEIKTLESPHRLNFKDFSRKKKLKKNC